MLMRYCPPSGCDSRSADLHREHSLDVPAHRHQIPFAFDVLQSSQQTLAITHHRFDDAEYWFWCLFAQRIKLSSSRSLQSMRHLLHRRSRVGWGFGSGGKALFPADMMARAPQGDQRFDLRRFGLLDVRLAQIAAVGKDAFDAAQFLRQCLE